MKNAFGSAVAAIVVLSASLAARAADLPPAPLPPPQAPAAYVPPPIPIYNWGGVYFGINGGWGLGTAKWTISGLAPASVQPSGGFIGSTLGVNYQMGAFVIGAEGDIDWSRINGSAAGSVCVVTGNCQTGNTWLSTLRARFGFAMDRVLFYGTAGGVFGNEQLTANGVVNTHTQAGWTVGLGVEAAFAQNWTAKFEYLYANLGTGTVTCTAICGGVPTPVSVGLTDNLFRAGLNYKFNL
jgi:outer membrane immunogenic protein